jgi:hypothetical protein
LDKLARVYAKVNPSFQLYLNDASLEWGGLFDVEKGKPWKPPHETHQRGRSLDIRAESAAGKEGEVPVAKFIEFRDASKKKGLNIGLHCQGSSADSVCDKQPSNRHIHADF